MVARMKIASKSTNSAMKIKARIRDKTITNTSLLFRGSSNLLYVPAFIA